MSAEFNPNRPADMVIVEALAAHFHVDACVIVAWLKQIDHRAVTEAIAAR